MNLSFIRPTYVVLGSIGIALAGVILFAALSVHAEAAPVLTQSIENTSNVGITTAPISTMVHDVVSVASSTSSTTPTGTVDFNVFANTACTGTPTTQSGVALINGIATSSDTTIGAAGLSYTAHYNGDASTTPATSQCVAVAATSASVGIANQLSTTTAVLAGTIVTDTAALSGATANASGTVAYNIYSNAACSNLLVGGGIKNVANAMVPTSNQVQFNFAGTYFWQSVYSGDQNNSTATSSCTTLTVVATSTPVTGTTTPPVIAPEHHGEDENDNDDDSAASVEVEDHDIGIGQEIHDFIKSHFANGHDNGKHLGQLKHHKEKDPGSDDNGNDD